MKIAASALDEQAAVAARSRDGAAAIRLTSSAR